MMDYHKEFINDVMLFANEYIRPFAQTHDIKQHIPDSLITAMARQGYLGVSIPKEYGGLGLDALTYGVFNEEIGKACCSTRALITVHTSLVAETLLQCGNINQKQQWLPCLANGEMLASFALSEEDAGSDASSLQTKYERIDDHFIINGTKKWVTFGNRADICLVFATNGNHISAFLVDLNRDGITKETIHGLMVNRATDLASIHFNNVSVPEENLLAQEGSGFNIVANVALENGRYNIAWAGIAIAHEALDTMVTYVKRRKQFGQRLCQFQMVQGIIADAKTNLEAARALATKAGYLRQQQHPDATMITNIAKLFCSRLAVKVSNDALQTHGARGFEQHSAIQRLYREAKLLEIIEGSTQIQQQIIATAALNEHDRY